MDIFESLENLNVSEECFGEIMGLVEELINELKDSTIDSMIDKRGSKGGDVNQRYHEKEYIVKNGGNEMDKREMKQLRRLRDTRKAELMRANDARELREFRKNPTKFRNDHIISPEGTTDDEIHKVLKRTWKDSQKIAKRVRGYATKRIPKDAIKRFEEQNY